MYFAWLYKLTTDLQIYKAVTVLFSDVVDFNWICSQVTPMQIVSMLNAYFTEFDKLTERHGVYKVNPSFLKLVRCYEGP